MTRNKLFQAIAGGVVLAASASGAAHAIPSYAYSNLNFTNFALSGVIGNSNVTVNNSAVLGFDSANYPTAPTIAANSLSGNTATGVDVPQAITGPAASPENNFNQFYLPTSALVPAGARGDGLITGALATGANSNLVAEGKLSVSKANAGASSGSSTTLNVTVGASNQTVTLTFNASDSLMAMVGTTGDSANALDSASFKIVDTATNTPILITDNINAANSSTNIAPAALNTNVATTNASTPQSFSSGPTAYSYSASLLAGKTYQITLQDSTQVILSTVPEPASLALLGSGLAALGLFRLKRKNG